ncbi:hypothetical protein HHL16_10640 [Pseudoflavitalea sp. G-6-1-2]|uniref:hypothetical protein n=1 Tax=Pseudoflavitalea sp. G-6-1-2 TaxID=2728841 RepID=UPI00146E34A9|nr:hypothetical protein [Pseudoflavitalea sp. G-6-1-2]NML21333.1 hypothetical protein [Pseudoflavitalea sp. G-6-1-2]
MKKTAIALSVLVMAACQQPDAKSGDTKSSADSAKKVTEAPKPVAYSVPENLLGEHIDGPANVRDKVKGKAIFSLNDQTVVTAREPENGWTELGLLIDPTVADGLKISKGAVLTWRGKPVGKALEDFEAWETAEYNNEKSLVIGGFSTDNNIRKETLMENVFMQLAADSSKPLTLERMQPFLKSYQFETFTGLLDELQGYMYYDAMYLSPSPSPRFWPVFKGNELVAVFHSRKITIPGVQVSDPALYMSVFTRDEALIKKLKAKHIQYMNAAG